MSPHEMKYAVTKPNNISFPPRMEIELLKEKIRHLELNQMKQEVEHKQIQQQQQQQHQHFLRNEGSTESSNGSLGGNENGDFGDATSPGGLQLRSNASQQLSLPLQLHDVNSVTAKRKISPLTLTSSASIGGVGHPMSR